MTKWPSHIVWLCCMGFLILWAIVIVLLLSDDVSGLQIVAVQVSLFAVLLTACFELTEAQSKWSMPSMLVFAVIAGILTHAVLYKQLGLVMSVDQELFYPQWRDALYFSVVTFTTLGYGDMAPHEEYRLVAAFQAIYGYLFLGALVGMLVAVFKRQ